jgi:formate dehydrogenase subunit delta
MSDTTETLARMVNQIAANLMRTDDPAAEVAEHIRLFWDPRMKSLIEQIDRSRLSDVASKAIDLLQQSGAKASECCV